MFMWAIIRKPTVSMPSLLASLMCCAETSASVQWVATRMQCTPQSTAMRRWSTVPMPGSSSAETFICFMRGMTARRYSSSVCSPKP